MDKMSSTNINTSGTFVHLRLCVIHDFHFSFVSADASVMYGIFSEGLTRVVLVNVILWTLFFIIDNLFTLVAPCGRCMSVRR